MFWLDMGLAGLIIATIINHAYSNIVIISYAKVKLKIDVYLGEILKRFLIVLVVSMVAGGVSYLINISNEIVEFVLKGSVFLVVVFIGMFLMKFEELDMVKAKVMRAKSRN